MYVARVDYRRNFTTAEDMVEAMNNSGEIIGICQCTIAIAKRRIAAWIASAILLLAAAWFIPFMAWIVLIAFLVFVLIKWLRYKPDLVVITESKTYFFTKVQCGQKEAGYAFRDIYRIDNDDIDLQKIIQEKYPLLDIPGNYYALLLPSLLKKPSMFSDKAITIQQAKHLLFG